MLEIEIVRDRFSDHSTGGVLTCGDWTCYTLELPWMSGANLHGQSAILEGRYKISIYYSPRLESDVLLLHDVPGRLMIEIHPANKPSELLGCIAVGMTRGDDEVLSSRAAFTLLRDLVRGAILNGEEAWLTVRNLETLEPDSGSSLRV